MCNSRTCRYVGPSFPNSLSNNRQVEELEVASQGCCKPGVGWIEGLCPCEQLFEKMSMALPPHEGLIDYFVYLAKDAETRYCAMLWLPDRVGPILRDLGGADRVNTLISQFQDCIFKKSQRRIEQGVQTGHVLREAILDPILRELPSSISFLHICPDGELAGLAFCCLPINEVQMEPTPRYPCLLHRYTIKEMIAGRRLLHSNDPWATTPDPKQRRLLHSSDPRATMPDPKQAVVFANPAFGADSGWESLPDTQEEANCVQKLFPKSCTVLTGAEATREAFLSNMTMSPFVLHVATHGTHNSRREIKLVVEHAVSSSCPPEAHGLLTDFHANPLLRCCLIAAGGERITALDILGSNLKNTRIASLSCCYSARGDVRCGEGTAGFAYAFTTAGVKNVMMGLDRIPDQKAARTLVYFACRITTVRHVATVRMCLRGLRTSSTVACASQG